MTATTGSEPLTIEDLERMPDDGRRYELVDGTLIVSPAPGTRHQKIVGELFFRLRSACTVEFEVLPAPFAVHVGENVELQPDILVARFEELTDKDLPTPPALAVEVLSPSTALNDLNTKKAAYGRMAVPLYWVVDPAEPRLTVFELTDGRYREVASVAGSESYDAHLPFPVRVVPADLLGRFRPDGSAAP